MYIFTKNCSMIVYWVICQSKILSSSSSAYKDRLQNPRKLFKTKLQNASEKHNLALTPDIFEPNKLPKRISPHRKLCPCWKTIDFTLTLVCSPKPEFTYEGTRYGNSCFLGYSRGCPGFTVVSLAWLFVTHVVSHIRAESLNAHHSQNRCRKPPKPLWLSTRFFTLHVNNCWAFFFAATLPCKHSKRLNVDVW